MQQMIYDTLSLDTHHERIKPITGATTQHSITVRWHLLDFTWSYHPSHMTQHAFPIAFYSKTVPLVREASISAHASLNWFENKSFPCILKVYEE